MCIAVENRGGDFGVILEDYTGEIADMQISRCVGEAHEKLNIVNMACWSWFMPLFPMKIVMTWLAMCGIVIVNKVKNLCSSNHLHKRRGWAALQHHLTSMLRQELTMETQGA